MPARLLCGAAIAMAGVGLAIIITINMLASRPIPVIVPVAYASEEAPSAVASPATPELMLASDVRPAAEEDLIALAKRDPTALLKRASDRYDREVRDYRCTFLKQEKLPDGLTPVQEILVLFRQAPQSCYMIWQKNAGKAKRALWIDDPKFVDAKGQRLAKVEPAGAVLRLVISDIMMPVRGADAKEQSRRAIDEFGFRSIFDLLETINTKARERGILDFRYDGTGEVDGRPTIVFRRLLPENLVGEYPDARMVLHIDRERLLPVAVFSYADHAGKDLLGSYVMTKVELNAGLTDEAFKF